MTPPEYAPASTIEAAPEEQSRFLTLNKALAIGGAVIATLGIAKAATVSAEAMPGHTASSFMSPEAPRKLSSDNQHTATDPNVIKKEKELSRSCPIVLGTSLGIPGYKHRKTSGYKRKGSHGIAIDVTEYAPSLVDYSYHLKRAKLCAIMKITNDHHFYFPKPTSHTRTAGHYRDNMDITAPKAATEFAVYAKPV
jgi:hypothetical protein